MELSALNSLRLFNPCNCCLPVWVEKGIVQNTELHSDRMKKEKNGNINGTIVNMNTE